MVAKITIPNTLRRALNYNEHKLKEGHAECIYAHHFLKDAPQLNFYEKLNRFQALINLNKRASTNAIHVSLNFAMEEKLDKEKLVEIAALYMEKIGFGGQPYLVYKHLDAGHPHIHIVSTNIQKDCRRISLHNIGKNQSNTARKEIESQFNLVRAEDQHRCMQSENIPLNIPKIQYGKSPVKRGITNVLDNVLPKYKYGSLAELNAVLKLFNVVADRGREDGIIFKQKGLLYCVLDKNGNKIGVPIKASSIYNKPTLQNLEKKFIKNKIQKQSYKKNLKTSIDWILLKPPKSLESFAQALEKEKISLVIRQNDNGVIYGLTYIDHNTKCVFNGSDIGSGYSAKAIMEKLGEKQNISREPSLVHPQPSDESISKNDIPQIDQSCNELIKIMDAIVSPSNEYQYLPFELKRQKKKKRKTQ